MSRNENSSEPPLTPEVRSYFSAMGRKGGKVSGAKRHLTPEQAHAMAVRRWARVTRRARRKAAAAAATSAQAVPKQI